MTAARAESPAHSRDLLSQFSYKGESDDLRGRRRRARSEADENPVHSRDASSRASCTDELGDLRARRRRVRIEAQDEPIGHPERRHRALREWRDALHAEVRRSRIRHECPHVAVSGRTELWRNWAARRDRHLVRACPHDWWIVPGEEHSFGRERAVQRSMCGAGRSLRDVPEGFCEKEESKRPRASLHGAQIMP
jgi:hypothetical protein